MDHSKREDEDSLTSSRSENNQDVQEGFEEQMSFISSRFDAMGDQLRMIEDKFTKMTEDLIINLSDKITREITNEISKKRIASDSFEDINTTSPHHTYFHELYLNELGRSDSRFDAMEDKLTMIEDKFTRITEDSNTYLRNEIQGMKNEISKKIIASNSFEDINTSSSQHSYLDELISSISLPGLRYVASCEPTLHRLLWIFIHIVAFLISYAYIKDAYDDWQRSPIIHSLTMTKAEDIPFPATTICQFLELREDYNQSEVYETCVKEVNDTFIWMCSEVELKMFLVADEIRPIFNQLNEYFYGLIIEKWKRSEYLKYIDKVVKPVNEEVLKSTLIMDNGQAVENVEMVVMVEERLCKCRTFNNINLNFGISQNHVNNQMNDYIQHNELKTSSVCTPDKILDSDCKSKLFYSHGSYAFETFEYSRIEEKDVSRFRMFFHSPADYPYSKHYVVYRLPAVPAGKHIVFRITPNLINAKKDLVQLDVSERNCLFSFEKRLSYFEFYTFHNCNIDCTLRCIMNVCGCVTRDYSDYNSSLPICSGSKTKDCGYASEWYDYNCTCNCPDECVSLTFEVKQEIIDVSASSNDSVVSYLYESPEFISSYRYSANNPGEFFAYTLGVLGVFNGFSFMLVWEILYWLTLRLWSTIKRYPHFQSRR